jgi:DNA-binding PadR family transcriptional regulator
MGLLATFFSRRSDHQIEQTILDYVCLHPESSGAQISKACEVGSARLYPALQRMEMDKRLTSRWANEPLPRRRLYSAPGQTT